ncbi:MAG: hypothetical protein EZS28_004270 [Streblomastix strix]|uniref:Uncharacterized protein n=1 Tax=Streblomastix strix TaxID=222440 RepID=A0A5J4WZ56_9EUKA|nr:MAG: hypothetical protein EZS28_004270 [Streblomastix strix]
MKADQVARQFRTGVRAHIIKRMSQVAAIVNPDRTENDKLYIKTYIYYIMTQLDENPTFESQKILILPERISQQHKDISREWFKIIQLPPSDLQFIDVKSADDGTWDDGTEIWRLNPHFNADDGLIPSSLIPSKIRSFNFELHRAIIILENGAVFAYGQLHEFQGWPNVAENGFIESTDRIKMKQCFLDELRGGLSGAEGAFGVFETFHVVKYYKNAKAFVTAEGIVLTQTYVEIEKKYKYSFTPIDPKFFGGEKIVHINHHVWDAYVTKTGRVLIIRGMYKESKEFVTELTTPQKVLQLPFFMDELHCLILTKKTHFTALRADGRIFSIRYEDGAVRNATDYAIQHAKSNIQEYDKRIKHFTNVAMSFDFLFE